MIAKAASPAQVDGALVVDRALDYTSRKAGVQSRGDALAKIADGDLATYLYFRYGLAKEAACQAADMCDGIESGLLFLENRCESVPGEPVLVGLVTPRKTAALQALVESISEAVKREVGKRVPVLAGFESVLSLEVIDSQEVTARKGLGAMVSSINEPPIQVWPQQ